MSVGAIERYLEQPPYCGRSHVRDNVAIKRLCGPTAQFDQSRKVWSTRCEDALRSLVASKKWQPIGIKESAYAHLMRAAQERRLKAEAEWVAAEEAKAVVRKAAEEQRRVKAARAVSTMVITEKKRKLQTAPAPKPEPAQASPPIKKGGGVGLEPSVAEVAECKRLGFTQEAIAHSNCCDELGPRGSLSSEGRILRWCSFFDHDDDVQELDHQARTRSWGGIEMGYTLPEWASRDYAIELNARAKEAQDALM